MPDRQAPPRHCRLETALLAGAVLVVTAPQDPEAVATYRVGAETRTLAAVDVALELGRRERLQPRGKDALDLLVNRILVTDAAKAAGIAATRAEIEARVEETRRALRGEGLELEGFLRDKNLSQRTFETEYIGLSVVHEKLVMRASGLRDRSEVTADLLALWLDEARTKAKVVIEPEQLSPGIVARVGARQLTLVELGEILLENSQPATRRRAADQIVIRALLEAEATARGFTATPEEIDAEIATRKKAIESDATFEGVGYEELLKAQGTSLVELRRSPVIRAQVFRAKLVAAEFEDAELDARIAKDRAAVLLRHGPRRHVHAIVVRAADPPNEFVPLSFEQALERAKTAIERIKDGMAFATAARIHSDDAQSKVRGGDLGMVSRQSTRLPREAIEAAYHLDAMALSAPIRCDDGIYVVTASEIEAGPSDAVLRERLREELGADYVRELLTKADVQLSELR